MKFKKLNLSLSIFVLILLFGFYWYMKNSVYIFNFIPADSVLQELNDGSQGFSSMRAYTLNYAFFFLLLMKVYTQSEKPHIVTRSKSRKSLYIKKLISVFNSAFLFSFIYSLINLTLTTFFYGFNILIESNFILILLFNLIILTLFYWWVGLIEQTLEDKGLSMNVSMIITFVIVALLYFLRRKDFWVPVNDLIVYDYLLKGIWGYTDLLLAYGRHIAIVCILIILGSLIYKEKDFITYEQ